VKLFSMAWRNVWRNRRRTLVTVAAMTLAMVATINYSGLGSGYLYSMERNLLDLAMGDVQVFAPGYRDRPSLYTRIGDAQDVLGKLDAVGLPASARLRAVALGAAGETSAGVSLIGLDVVRDKRVSRMHEQVSRGEWLDPAASQGVVIGRRLARTLGLEPGDEMVVLTQAADGSLANELYRVRGVLKGVADTIDRTGVFLTEAAFRELMVLPEGAHQLIVRRNADTTLEQTHDLVAEAATDLDVKTWRELMPTLASMLDSAKGIMGVFVFIVYLAIAFVILNAMLMAVFERVREFGVLKALGVGPGGVLALIFVESAIQVVLAIAAGLALGTPLLLYLAETGINLGPEEGMAIAGLAWDPVMHARITQDTFTTPIVLFVFVVALAVLYPALKAALIKPVSAMRHQ